MRAKGAPGSDGVPAETGFGALRGPPTAGLREAEVAAGEERKRPLWLWGKEGGFQIQPQAGMVRGTLRPRLGGSQLLSDPEPTTPAISLALSGAGGNFRGLLGVAYPLFLPSWLEVPSV